MTSLKKDQCITVDVERLVYGGEGLARYESHEVLVHRGVPGDRVVVRVTEVKGVTIRGEITEVMEPSPLRLHPECPAFHDGCGGCQWLHIAYDGQLAWKKRIVEEILRQYEPLEQTQIHDVIGMDVPFFYRNKMVVRVRGPAEQLRVGFHTSRTKWLINVFNKEDGKCYIQNDLNSRLGRGLAASLIRKRLPLKSATIRTSDEDEVSLDLDRKLAASISSDLQGIGQQTRYVHYTIHDLRFRVTSPSFFQANTLQTGALVHAVMGMLPERRLRTVVDIYCGVGLFSLFMAGRAEQVYGIEESHTAIADAEYNAGAHRISNIRFVRGKAEDEFPAITAEEGHIDTVLVDPPRAGCDTAVLHTISRCRPDTLIYVSCNVSTLARDLAILHEHGFSTTDVQPVDMFPHTYHIECVAKCVRR